MTPMSLTYMSKDHLWNGRIAFAMTPNAVYHFTVLLLLLLCCLLLFSCFLLLLPNCYHAITITTTIPTTTITVRPYNPPCCLLS